MDLTDIIAPRLRQSKSARNSCQGQMMGEIRRYIRAWHKHPCCLTAEAVVFPLNASYGQ